MQADKTHPEEAIKLIEKRSLVNTKKLYLLIVYTPQRLLGHENQQRVTREQFFFHFQSHVVT